jgi:uncharacterized protein YbcI
MSTEKHTKGELQDLFTKAIMQFEKEYLGRGPLNGRTYLINDMVLVRLRGVLTPTEEKLVQNKEGRVLVKETRSQLFETSRPMLEEMVAEILDTTLVDFYSDISIQTGERIIVLTVGKDFGN